MLLLVLLACVRPTGTFYVTFGAPSTTCPSNEVPRVPTSSKFRVWRGNGAEDADGASGNFGVAPFGVCDRSLGGFRCDLAGLDARDDLTGDGVDAVVTQDLSFEGSWRDEGLFDDDSLEGTFAWAVRCEGSDCAALEGAMPTPCETTWSWTATTTYSIWQDEACSPAAASASARAYSYGPAPWDPYRVSDPPPVLVDEDGLLPRVPYVSDVVAEGAGLYAVTPEQAGATFTTLGAWGAPYTPVGLDDLLCPYMRTFRPSGESWTFGEHGRVEGFEPERALGAWSLRDGTLLTGGYVHLGDLLEGYLPALRLEVLAVDEGRATFRLVSGYLDGDGECVVVADRGDLSPTGELTWSADAPIVVPADPGSIVVYDPRIRIGFDDTSAAGGEAGALVDVRATNGLDLDVCALSDALDAPCVPCPDDGEPWCLPVAALAWQGDPAPDIAVGAPLPLCGADFTGEFPEIELDCGGWDGTFCVGASVFFVAPLRRLRRRRDAHRSAT